MKRLMTFGLLFAVLFLTACGGRGILATLPADTVSGQQETVLVATSRTRAEPPRFFGDERSDSTNYAYFQVSVPPGRQPGEVNYPRHNSVDPSTQFLVADFSSLQDQDAFINAINAEISRHPEEPAQGSLFVHGFNTNNAEGLMRAVALSIDTGREGVNIVYSWPSAASLLKYLDDRESALFARDAFEETLISMSRSRLEDYVVVGHSMGTFVVMDTLRGLAANDSRRTLEKIKAVILISADIDLDVFRKQALPVIERGVPIILITTQDDLALRLSSTMRGQDERVGDIQERSELGDLNVTVFDFSNVAGGDPLKHFKIGSSPKVLSLLKSLNQAGSDLVGDAATGTLTSSDALSLEQKTGVVVFQ